ncbi:MAG: dihydrofolate reductase family protein [Trebonia sp.]
MQLLEVDVLGQVGRLGRQLLVGRRACCSRVSTAEGSRPVRRRSGHRVALGGVKATPRLRSGSFRTAGAAGTRLVCLVTVFSFSVEGGTMRKLVLQQAAISLDGYICEEDTDFWRLFGPAALPPAPDDDEYEEYFLAGMSRAGTHIMGRVTYESMAGTWPGSTDPVAPLMNEIPKVVFSRSLESARWPESRIARGDMAEEIARLKAEPGGGILAHGGVRFVQSLVRLGLVDEYRLYVHPVAVGGSAVCWRLNTGP